MATTAGNQGAFRPRNLVVLSDGTGNSSAKLFRTNVWRMYEALDLICDDQIALYDDGVGTASFKPIAALGGAFGYGLKRNVLDLYTFLCRNYQVAQNFDDAPDDPARHDKIFAFGFSRGAFTARVLASLVANQGLICRARNDRDLNRLARWAYREYRADRFKTWFGVRAIRQLRDGLFLLKDKLLGHKPYERTKNRKVDIEFLGVFDTVAAYGLPFDELTRGWDRWIWPMLPRDRSLNPRVKCARHALAIDDERQTFFPLLWDEDSDSEQKKSREFGYPLDRVKQVWFAGMHSNVGGGYADDALSMVPLCWMAEEAAARGLRFQKHMRLSGGNIPDLWRERAASCAPMGDSRRGMAAYYRYHPRPIARLSGIQDRSNEPDPRSLVTIKLPKIHESVFERIRDARDSYAPFGLPEKYVVVTRDGRTLAGDAGGGNTAPNPYEHSTQAASRVREQEDAWDTVWLRRVVYFATIAATLFLLALPMIPQATVPAADASPNLKMAIGALGGFLPGFVQSVLGSYQDRPGTFFAVAIVVGLLLWSGSYLKGSVNDKMRRVWARRNGLQVKESELAREPGGWIYHLRESGLYKGVFRFMSLTFWPTVFGILILLILLVALPLRLTYQFASRTESFCKDSYATATFAALPADASGIVRNAAEFWFHPSDICRQSGLELKMGQKYAIQIAIPVDPLATTNDVRHVDEAQSCRNQAADDFARKSVGGWKDASIPVTSTAGIESSGMMGLFLPFRRIWTASWFVPIAAIGTKIPERHYLTEPALDFTPTRAGKLSLYVNDAAIPLAYGEDGFCFTWDCYYRNNVGGPARVRVTEVDANTTAKSLPPLEPYTCEEQLQKVVR